MKCAVVIPAYKASLTPNERISLYWTIKKLCKNSIYIVCPKKLRHQLQALFEGLCLGFQVFPDAFFSSIAGYNRLLKSKVFYLAFKGYDYMLIAQLDSLVLSDDIEYWCGLGYSYLGAPWFEGGACPSPGASLIAVGNGGLSLRHIGHHIKTLSFPRYLPYRAYRNNEQNRISKVLKFVKYEILYASSFPPFIFPGNEDFFWGLVVSSACDFFVVPSPLDALRFSFEVDPRKMFKLSQYNLPFGCHAWDRYDIHFWKEILPSQIFTAPDDDSFLRHASM